MMKNSKIHVCTYLTVSTFLFLDIFLFYNFKLSFNGYWIDRIIYWLWFIDTLAIVFSFWRIKWIKIYFGLLVSLLILSIVPMGIFFFGLFLSTTGEGRLNHFDLDNQYRIQVVNYSIIGRPFLEIIEKKGLFDCITLRTQDEIALNDSTYFRIRSAKKAQLINKTDTSVVVKYFFEKDTISATHVLKDNDL